MMKSVYKMKTVFLCFVCMLLLAQNVLADDHVNLSIAETEEEIDLNVSYHTQDLNVLAAGILMADTDGELNLDTPGRTRIAFASMGEGGECSLAVPNNLAMQSMMFRAYLIASDQSGSQNVYYSSQYAPKDYEENSGTFVFENIVYHTIENGLEVAGVVSQVAELEIPEDVSGQKVIRIAERAFEGDTVLISIDLPDTIQTIGKRAFAGCASLRNMK